MGRNKIKEDFVLVFVVLSFDRIDLRDLRNKQQE